MEYEQLIEELTTMQRDEQLYKDYYYLQQNGDSDSEFLNRYKTDTEALDYAIYPEHLPAYSPEDEFISRQGNVAIIKHPRFLPLFYHEHAFFEIIYVLSGHCIQRLPDRKIEMSAGDLFLLAPNVIHGIEVFDTDCIVLNILIRRSTFLDVFMNTVRDKTDINLFFLENIYAKKKIRYIIFHTAEDIIMRNYILDMYCEYLRADEFSDRIICSLLTIFFTQLTRSHKRSLEIPEAYKQKGNYEISLINHVINHYNTISLVELSRQFHFSTPYCSRLIKEITGYTFSELLTNIRIQQGENLLLYTQLSVTEISEKIGYKNPETFIRIFKRCRQTTPSQYRRSNHP